jgi:hypothetical protein
MLNFGEGMCFLQKSDLNAMPLDAFLGAILVFLAFYAGHLLSRDTCFPRLRAKRSEKVDRLLLF